MSNQSQDVKMNKDDEKKCKKCGHAKKHHSEVPVFNNRIGADFGAKLYCHPPYPNPKLGISCGCDGFEE